MNQGGLLSSTRTASLFLSSLHSFHSIILKMSSLENKEVVDMSREDKLEAELLKKARIEALKKTMEIEKQKREK